MREPKGHIEISNPALLESAEIDANFIKVVVEFPDECSSGDERKRALYKIDPKMNLSQIIDDICHKFNVPGRHKYSLLVGNLNKKV